MTRFTVVLSIALGVVVAAEVTEKVKVFKLYNKGVLRTVPVSDYPEVLGYLKQALKKDDPKSKVLLVADEIIRHPEKNTEKKRCFITEFADEEGKLYGAGISRYDNGTVVLRKEPNEFANEELTKLVKAGKVDEARQQANNMIRKLARELKKGRP